jgi:preprotein translocase subunit YajC
VMLILAQSSSNTQGGSLLGLLLPLVMIGGLYFILIRPQRTRQKAQQSMLAQLEVGDEVMLSGGMFGTVTEIDDVEGWVRVEIAPGTEVRVVRGGIAQRFAETAEDEGYDEPDDSDEEADRSP